MLAINISTGKILYWRKFPMRYAINEAEAFKVFLKSVRTIGR